MRHKPEHTCFHDCAGCAFQLGTALATRKPKEPARYVWMVVDSKNPCDIRRYAFSYEEAIAQLAHLKKKKGRFKDRYSGGTWTLFKLTQVKKTL